MLGYSHNNGNFKIFLAGRSFQIKGAMNN